MGFDTLDTAIYTATFLVPGFIWSGVLSMLVPRKARGVEARGLEFLTLSCINHALWIWLLFPVFKTGFSQQHPVWTGLFLLVIMGVSPVGLGVLTGVLLQKDPVKWLLGRFGFKTIHPIPTAWDYQFSRGKPYWVIVRLKDGSTVYGLYGLRSFASDEPDERDLYVEAVFRPNEHDEWVPIEDSGGTWIAGDEIAAIEFRKLTEVDYGE